MNESRNLLPRLWLRSFLVQSAWNPERMLNLGLTMMMAPVVEHFKGTGPPARAALRRYLRFFNTHPYLMSLVVGLAAREEAAGIAPDPARPERSYDRWLGPLAAVGGATYWEGVRPFLCLLGVSMTYLLPSPSRGYGVVLMLVVYNLIQGVVRWRGLVDGWREGEAAVRRLLQRFQANHADIRRAGLFLLGGLLAFLPEKMVLPHLEATGLAATLPWYAGCWLVFGVFLFALRHGFGVTRLIFLLTVFSLLGALVGGWGPC